MVKQNVLLLIWHLDIPNLNLPVIYFLPWMVGRNPKLKIIQSTNTTELSVRFGRKAKQLMDTPEYKEVFKTRLKKILRLLVNGKPNKVVNIMLPVLDLQLQVVVLILIPLMIPHTEARCNECSSSLRELMKWYTSGPRQRLQPGGTIIIVMTRWNEKDLAGRLLKAQKEPKADQWELIEFPAIMPSGGSPVAGILEHKRFRRS